MAFTPTSSTETESFFKTGESTNISICNTYMISGTNYHMFATTTTTTFEVRGLTKAQALAYSGSSDYNYDARHGVMFQSAYEFYSWMKADRCEGAVCRAEARRINDADMWRVTITYSYTTVTHSAWTIKSTY